MSHLFIGLSLALVASVALNASYLIQHAGSVAAPTIAFRHPVRTLGALLRSPLWLAGGVLGISGWAMSIAAITQAPLSLVQAFLIGGIALLAPVAVRVLGHRLAPRELAGISLVLFALLVLLVGQRAVGVHSHFHNAALGIYLSGSVSAGACLLLFRQRRTQMLAATGGILYGAADVSIKALTGLASHHGLTAALASPWLIATVVASIGAFFCFQRALQSGKPLPVIALMTAGNNIVSIIGGLVVFGDPLGHRPVMVLVHAAAFVLIVVAAWLLAPAQAAATVPGAADKHVSGSSEVLAPKDLGERHPGVLSMTLGVGRRTRGHDRRGGTCGHIEPPARRRHT